MSLNGNGPLLEAGSEYEYSAQDIMGVGTKVMSADGRVFRWGQMGAVAGVTGKLYLPPLDQANHHNMTTAAATIGATVVTVTPGATAVTANEYANGYLVVSDGTGKGTSYPIISHQGSAGSVAMTVTLKNSIKVALDSTSKTALVHNPYMGLTVQTTSASVLYGGGVPLVAIPAGNYGWFQTRGWCSVLNDSNTTASSTVIASTSVAGALAIISTTYATAAATAIIGQASIVAPVDAKYNDFFLTIDAA